MVKHTLELQWKDHSVNLEALNKALKELSSDCCGCSADSSLKVHFTEVPSDEVLAAIKAKWAELDDPEHEMCKSYKSQADLLAEKEAKKQSAKAKLAALGLDAEEVAALLG